MKEIKIAKEQAESEFQEWCDANGIDADISEMNEEDEKGFRSQKKRIVKAIMEGRCAIDGRSLKYTISDLTKTEGLQGKEVEIMPPDGYVYTAMGGGDKKGNEFKRLNAGLSQMTGLADGMFNKMDVLDVKFFHAVASLFLAD